MLPNQEFIQDFIEEAMTHLENIDFGMLKLEEDSSDRENVNGLFRAVHSIKGTAGFFGFQKIVELAHAMENVFGEIRNGKLEVSAKLINALLNANDCLKAMLADLGQQEQFPISQQLNDLSELLEPEHHPEAVAQEKPACLIAPNQEKITVAGMERQLILDSLKHGHQVYRVSVRLNADLSKKNINPIHFFKQVQSFGNLIVLETDISQVQSLGDCFTGLEFTSEITISLLFTTVLAQEMIPLALGITKDSIERLQLEQAERRTAIQLSAVNPGVPEQLEINRFPFEASGTWEEPEKETVTSLKTSGSTMEESIRVQVNLLNNLLNLAGELVLGRNQLLRALEKHQKSIAGMESILQNIDRITTELQDKVMQTRMQPVANILNKFPRIVRDLSKKVGKEVELNLDGTEVELDKSIIEALGDPLTHIIRNAIDHGLESPAERERAGKSRQGLIQITAYHEGGYVNIDITDDGAGIDLGKVKNKAVERGLITKAEAETFSEQQTLQLLFKPGFSTAEKISDISGRGVGMDVVKTNIERLGGAIEIQTKTGLGTTIRLLLPLTLAIIPSLIVEVEGQRFALPQANLEEIVRIKPGDSKRRIEFLNNAEVLRLRDQLLPVVHLADVLELQRTYLNPESGQRIPESRRALADHRSSLDEGTVPEERRSASGILRILVLKLGLRQYGIVVDQIHGGEEILVKPLPSYIKECHCYSGVTILGDGKIAMILDPEGVSAKAGLRFGEEYQVNHSQFIESKDYSEQQNLLLFKSSGPETLGLDLSLVARVEVINAKQIEAIGEMEYIKFGGEPLRVIRPEQFLPLNKNTDRPEKLYVIIPKLVKHPIGILAETILDTVYTTIIFDDETIKARGIIGTAVLQEQIVLLINLYDLFEAADPEHYQVKDFSSQKEPKNLLLVEDTPFFQKIERNYLEQAGFSVLSAANGQEALNLLEKSKVDAVVSDIHMPVMDGLELVKKIREDKRFSDLPVIAVTSMTGDLQMQAGLEAGFDFYEFKLDRARLLEKVGQALSKGKEAIG